MLKKLCLTLFILLSTAMTCHGLEVVAVKSSPAQPYEDALQSLHQHLTSLYPVYGPKTIQPDIAITSITLSKEDRAEAVTGDINRQKPDIIVALGSKALRFTSSIKNIPIIYLLVPSPEKIVAHQDNITGVLLQHLAGAQFRALKRIMPSVKRIGVIYDPAKTEAMVENAAKKNNDLIFVRRQARSPQEVANQLTSLTGEIDLLWMLPDSTILSPQTEKSFYRFAHLHKIPILAFSEKYLARGASFATHLDLEQMGHLAALLALRIHKGEAPKNLPPLQTDKVDLMTNDTIIDKLGITLQEVGP